MARRADQLREPRQPDRRPEHGQGGYSEEQRLHLEELALETLEDVEAEIEHALRENLFDLAHVRRRRAELLAARARRNQFLTAAWSLADSDDAEGL